MDEEIEERINDLGSKIDIIKSVNNALMSSLLGVECLTQKDTYSFVYLLEDKINDLKIKHEKLVTDLKI